MILTDKYPQFFPDPSVLQTPDGWNVLLDYMFDAMSQDRRVNENISIRQLKEKFGSLRCYWEFKREISFEDQEYVNAFMSSCLTKYTATSESICMECGKVGKVVVSTEQHRLVKVVCEEHAVDTDRPFNDFGLSSAKYIANYIDNERK